MVTSWCHMVSNYHGPGWCSSHVITPEIQLYKEPDGINDMIIGWVLYTGLLYMYEGQEILHHDDSITLFWFCYVSTSCQSTSSLRVGNNHMLELYAETEIVGILCHLEINVRLEALNEALLFYVNKKFRFMKYAGIKWEEKWQSYIPRDSV